ncbi:preprotein translocase subunit SecG [Candidatus Parcubacteria bacterium]|nr:preprotein translocase subunit SecG [Patescibacteria group bacterium]MBU4466865.1 preprotein translocase subunit SecG [Patescibacteria group bacterium]MCG2688592.1 preprotein translocase subunit SecG [Candidatus Parcubacteria bacterium]
MFSELVSIIKPYLPVAQITVSLILIVLILIQPRGQSLGSAFGQSFAGVGKLRGASKLVFYLTIALGIVFILLALINLLP